MNKHGHRTELVDSSIAVFPPPPIRPTPLDCIGDVAFVLDSSGSINDESRGRVDNWQIILGFTRMLTQNLNVGPSKTRIAVVSFSNKAEVWLHFDSFRGARNEITNAILNIPYDGGNTNTTGGLNVARTQVFSQGRGDRPNVPDIIILLTDGKPTVDTDRLPNEIDLLKRRNIPIIGVGVGPAVDNDFLRRISDHQFHVNDFNELRTLVQRIIDRSCAIVKR